MKKLLVLLFVVGSVVSPLYGGVVASYKGNFTTTTIVETPKGIQYEYALNGKVKDVYSITIDTSEALSFDDYGLFNSKGDVEYGDYFFTVSDKTQQNAKITLFTHETVSSWGTITLTDECGETFVDKCPAPSIPEVGSSFLFVFGLGLLVLRVKH